MTSIVLWFTEMLQILHLVFNNVSVLYSMQFMLQQEVWSVASGGRFEKDENFKLIPHQEAQEHATPAPATSNVCIRAFIAFFLILK